MNPRFKGNNQEFFYLLHECTYLLLGRIVNLNNKNTYNVYFKCSSTSIIAASFPHL